MVIIYNNNNNNNNNNACGTLLFHLVHLSWEYLLSVRNRGSNTLYTS
jgi:hypothetical protein